MDVPQPANSSFSLVELFAGIGGASLALAPSFTTLLANDNSPLKAEYFRRNHPCAPFDSRSITELRAADLPKADLLWASFPCVDHSALGGGQGFDGKRGSLVFEMLRILGEHRLLGSLPPLVCCENVPRFVSHDGGKDFAALVQSLVSMGYRVGGMVVDSEQFLPVLRKRLFLVAVRRDVDVPPGIILKRPDPVWHPKPLVEAVATLPLHARRAWMWLGMPQPDAPVPPLASLLDDGEEQEWFTDERVQRVLSGCRSADVAEVDRLRLEGQVLAIVAAQRADRMEGRRPALPIYTDGFARCLTAGAARQLVLRANADGIRIRNVTGAELARLLGLPPSFELPSTLSGSWKCVGDGLCIPVVAWLGRHILAPLAAASEQPHIVRPGTEMLAGPPSRKRRGPDAVERVGIKHERASTSIYLTPADLDRLHRQAANDAVPLHEWILRELDATLARQGQPPLERWVSKRDRGRGSSNEYNPSRDAAFAPKQPKAPSFFKGGAAHLSTHCEWWTPQTLVQSLLDALGLKQFDLDAFSPGATLSHVPASKHYTRADNALVQPWHGVVFANPPYGRGIIQPCVARCRQAFGTGEARLVVGILPVRVETRWWSEGVTGWADVIMPTKRISFIDGTGREGGSPAHASAIALWGATATEVAAMRALFPHASFMPRQVVTLAA